MSKQLSLGNLGALNSMTGDLIRTHEKNKLKEEKLLVHSFSDRFLIKVYATIDGDDNE